MRRRVMSQFQNSTCSNYEADNFSLTSLTFGNTNPLKTKGLALHVCVHDYQRLPLRASEKHFIKIQHEDRIKSLEIIIVFSFGECSSYI